MESGIAWPAAPAGTLARSATPLLWPGALPFDVSFGQRGLSAPADNEIHEVDLEVTRTSAKYRLRLRTAYTWFVRWVESIAEVAAVMTTERPEAGSFATLFGSTRERR